MKVASVRRCDFVGLEEAASPGHIAEALWVIWRGDGRSVFHDWRWLVVLLARCSRFFIHSQPRPHEKNTILSRQTSPPPPCVCMWCEVLTHDGADRSCPEYQIMAQSISYHIRTTRREGTVSLDSFLLKDGTKW